MGTLAVTASGFSALPATAPANWPAEVTWPGGGAVNGTKNYTISDADWVALLTWTAASQAALQGTAAAPSTPTGAQILVAWVQIWISGTRTAVQQFFTTQPMAPPPISIQ